MPRGAVAVALRHGAWAPLVPLLFALVLLPRSLPEVGVQARLALFGQTATGTVIDRDSARTDRLTLDRGITRTPQERQVQGSTYAVAYAFPVPGQAAPVEGRMPATEAQWRALAPGAQVAVRFLPARPEVNRAAPLRRNLPWALAAAGLALLVLAAALALRGPGARARSALRARSGPTAQARVTAHLDEAGGNGQRARIVWTDAQGVTGTGGPALRNSLPPLGAPVTLRIDPATGRAWWERDL